MRKAAVRLPGEMFDLIFTTSRASAEAFCWPEPFALISITDPGSQSMRLRQPTLVARCDLAFWDLAFVPGDDRVIFDSKMAQKVLRFVTQECGPAKLLLIHCEAGISRSAGLANALGAIYGIEVRHQNAEFLSPNPLVIRILHEAIKGT
jgi:predicted protein tyrosine phosphatase